MNSPRRKEAPQCLPFCLPKTGFDSAFGAECALAFVFLQTVSNDAVTLTVAPLLFLSRNDLQMPGRAVIQQKAISGHQSGTQMTSRGHDDAVCRVWVYFSG